MHNKIMRKLVTSFLMASGLVLSSGMKTHEEAPELDLNIAASWVNHYTPHATSNDEICYSVNKLKQLNKHILLLNKEKANDEHSLAYFDTKTAFQNWYARVLNTKDSKLLPLSFEALFMQTLTAHGLELDQAEAQKFYQGYKTPPRVQKWWLMKNHEFLIAVSADKDLMEVMDNWSDKPIVSDLNKVTDETVALDLDHMMFIAKVSDMRRNIFGIKKKPEIGFKYNTGNPENETYTNASFGGNVLTIYTGNPNQSINHPTKLIGTTAHEIDHMVQENMPDNTPDFIGNSAGQETYNRLSVIFQQNVSYHYKSSKKSGFLLYTKNPVEQVAKTTSNWSKKFFDDRKAYEKEYKERLEALDEQIDEIYNFQNFVHLQGGVACLLERPEKVKPSWIPQILPKP